MNEYRPGPRLHAEIIGNEFRDELITKYMLGHEEHGHKGHILDIPLSDMIGNALDEAKDDVVYLKSAIQQIDWLKAWISELFESLRLREEPLSQEEVRLIEKICQLLKI